MEATLKALWPLATWVLLLQFSRDYKTGIPCRTCGTHKRPICWTFRLVVRALFRALNGFGLAQVPRTQHTCLSKLWTWKRHRFLVDIMICFWDWIGVTTLWWKDQNEPLDYCGNWSEFCNLVLIANDIESGRCSCFYSILYQVCTLSAFSPLDRGNIIICLRGGRKPGAQIRDMHQQRSYVKSGELIILSNSVLSVVKLSYISNWYATVCSRI
jgi:hypothetical protein